MKITRDGRTESLWVKAPDRFRWNYADGANRIARGRTGWLVDEKADRAVPRPPAACFRAERGGLDLLALLPEASPQLRSRALKTPQLDRVTGHGRTGYRYVAEGPGADGQPLRLEALVDTATRLPGRLTLWPVGRQPPRPVAEINVVAVGQPVDDSLFIVADRLIENGRVGEITDVVGTVAVKPLTSRRFTPVATHTLLWPGDWLRTDARGANAARVPLTSGAELVLGPEPPR